MDELVQPLMQGIQTKLDHQQNIFLQDLNRRQEVWRQDLREEVLKTIRDSLQNMLRAPEANLLPTLIETQPQTDVMYDAHDVPITMSTVHHPHAHQPFELDAVAGHAAGPPINEMDDDPTGNASGFHISDYDLDIPKLDVLTAPDPISVYLPQTTARPKTKKPRGRPVGKKTAFKRAREAERMRKEDVEAAVEHSDGNPPQERQITPKRVREAEDSGEKEPAPKRQKLIIV